MTDAGSPAAPPAPEPRGAHPETRRWLRRYARTLAVPVLIWLVIALAVVAPLRNWLSGENTYDRTVLVEWLEESRFGRDTLPEMVSEYLERLRKWRAAGKKAVPPAGEPLAALSGHDPPTVPDPAIAAALHAALKRAEILEQLEAMGNPPTKMYPNQLPLFPMIYRLQVRFDQQQAEPITWDSQIPCDPSQYQELEHPLPGGATVSVRYQLHAHNKRWRLEQQHNHRLRQLEILAVAGVFLGLAWVILVQRRERERERQNILAQQQVGDAERRREETERKLLEQRLATQDAEAKALELKSQLYASIGIMAGSYAHNIKNLLVRPNDLLRRCLEADGLSGAQATMLNEVQLTLGTVTERLQQILHTVRRDPTHSQQGIVDLNKLVRELGHTWKDLAHDKWKLELVLELDGEALFVQRDASHLQQAVENLLFNARDATFEMRNHLRDEARQAEGLDAGGKRQALIAAASWRGRVTVRTHGDGERIVLEVNDNGAGMTEEVRRRCTETHFSTKRDNAIYEGHSTGMGLGLSFVVAILEHHGAGVEIDSAPLHGTTFRLRFPAQEKGPSRARSAAE
jgi:signal transduction histidine kinase